MTFVFSYLHPHHTPSFACLLCIVTEDHIGKIKDQLSKIVGMASENVRLFPYLTEQQRIVLLGKQKEENRLAFEEALRRKKAARAAKLKNKKPGAGKKKEDDDDDDESFRAEMKFDPNPVLVILPLPENKTIDSLQLESGSVRYSMMMTLSIIIVIDLLCVLSSLCYRVSVFNFIYALLLYMLCTSRSSTLHTLIIHTSLSSSAPLLADYILRIQSERNRGHLGRCRRASSPARERGYRGGHAGIAEQDGLSAARHCQHQHVICFTTGWNA